MKSLRTYQQSRRTVNRTNLIKSERQPIVKPYLDTMKILILKLNATGDVVRTTPLLRCLHGEITWITARNNLSLLDGLKGNLRSLCWEDRESIRGDEYDLVINLEDETELAAFVKSIRHRQLFGAYMNGSNKISYTEDSRRWFDMSLISVYGKREADSLKFQNRRTYQELVFEGLGFHFSGQKYILPESDYTELSGDVAIAPVAGAVVAASSPASAACVLVASSSPFAASPAESLAKPGGAKTWERSEDRHSSGVSCSSSPSGCDRSVPKGAFDLVSAHFLHSPVDDPRPSALRRAAW